MFCSSAAKPVPLTVIDDNAAPLVLFKDMLGSIVNVVEMTEAAAVVAPFALMLCVPPMDSGTTNVDDQLPLVSAITGEFTCAPSKVMTIPFSPDAKPLPVAITEAPIAPVVLLVERSGPTVKRIAVIEEATVVGPDATTLCVPEAETGTLKLDAHEPFASAVMGEPVALPSKDTIILVSFAAKPVPFMAIDVPGAPAVLPRIKFGVTLNVWGVTEDTVVTFPEARIGYEPAGIAGTVAVILHVPLEPAVTDEPI